MPSVMLARTGDKVNLVMPTMGGRSKNQKVTVFSGKLWVITGTGYLGVRVENDYKQVLHP
jgi:hypothetical protein